MTALRRTRLHATLGPASRDPEMVGALVAAGADGFRINFSHASVEQAEALVVAVRQAGQGVGRPLAIRQDLHGPRFRTGPLADGRAELRTGARMVLYASERAGDAEGVSVSHPEVIDALAPGDRVLIDEGAIELRVEARSTGRAECAVIRGGELLPRKGINLPGVAIPLPALTPKDREDLEVGIRLGVDFVSLSFVRTAEDVQEARAFLAERGAGVALVAKIEKPEAVESIQAIIRVVDGISLSRGDLGLEVGVENVPIVQERVIQTCRAAGTLVQVGGEVLDSLTRGFVPTRSEAADVAVMVQQGVDGISLSGETAVGPDPVNAITLLDRIVRRAEDVSAQGGRTTLPPLVAALRPQDEASTFVLSALRPSVPIVARRDLARPGWAACWWGVDWDEPPMPSDHLVLRVGAESGATTTTDIDEE